MLNNEAQLKHSPFTGIIHCSPKIKAQPALFFYSFVCNSSTKDIKNMRLPEHICYEMVNLILYYFGFGNKL